MRYVGTDPLRPDAADKVSGRARYVADLDVPGAWVGATVRAQVACGVLRGIALAPGFDWSNVAVVRAADVPGKNAVVLLTDDQPVLAHADIAHFGEPVALVAAPDQDTLRQALAAIRVDVDERPGQFDMAASDRCFKQIAIDKGEVDAAFAGAAHVVEGEYCTDSQEQMYIEPQGCVAWPPDGDGTVVVRGSLQCPYYVQKTLCAVLALPPAQVRVVACEVGGGFGGKEDHPSMVAAHAALLARACGRPVRLCYERHEDLAYTPKRHPSRVRHRTAVAADGALLAMDIDVLFDGGAYTTLSPVVLSRGVLHAAGAYRCDHVRIRGRVVATNHVPYGAFRGFGAPQTCFAIERQMDRVAAALGLHPFELRRRNVLRPGDSTATGQVLDHAACGAEVLATIDRHTGIAAHPRRVAGSAAPARVHRGRGLSLFCHGAGFTGSGEQLLQSRVAVRLDGDGRAHVAAAATEIGQGTRAMLLAIAADSLGAAIEDVALTDADTAAAPDSGPTVASRTCMIVGGLVARACRELRARVGGDATQPFRQRAATFVRAGGEPLATAVYAPPPGLHWDDVRYRGDAYPVFAFAADVAEVEVDVDTFAVRVTGFTTVVDVGKAIQPKLVEGQLEGGSLQALGFAHMEVVSSAGGRVREDRMATCIVPTAADAPPMRVVLLEQPFAFGPFGAKGIGELPMDGGAPAVAAAIEDALGIRVDRVPASPERLLAAWLAAHPEEVLR